MFRLCLEGGGTSGTNDKGEFHQIAVTSGKRLALVRETLGGSTMYSRSRAVAELEGSESGLALTVTQFGVDAGVCVNDTPAHGTVALRAGDRVCFSRCACT